MRLLIDTATFIWAVASPERISTKALRALSNSQAQLELSSISLSEIAIKQALGKLDFSPEDVRIGVQDLKLRILPYTADHAYKLFSLPRHHGDPFDRQIISQAVVEGIALVSSDQMFKLYTEVEVLW